jgi:hypothetical protein
MFRRRGVPAILHAQESGVHKSRFRFEVETYDGAGLGGPWRRGTWGRSRERFIRIIDEIIHSIYSG